MKMIKVTAFRLNPPWSFNDFLKQEDSLDSFDIDKLASVDIQDSYYGKTVHLSRLNLSVFPFKGTDFKPDELGLLDSAYGIKVSINNSHTFYCAGTFSEYTISAKIDCASKEIFKMNLLYFQATEGFKQALADDIALFIEGYSDYYLQS